MALDIFYETEVLGRSVSAANRRTDLFELVRQARLERAHAVGAAVGDALADAFHALGKGLVALAHSLEGWRKRRETFGELMALDDRLLSDIGIHRADIPAIAESATTHEYDTGRVVTSGSYTRAI